MRFGVPFQEEKKVKLWPKASKLAITPGSTYIMNSIAAVDCSLELASARIDASKQKEEGKLKNKCVHITLYTHILILDS